MKIFGHDRVCSISTLACCVTLRRSSRSRCNRWISARVLGFLAAPALFGCSKRPLGGGDKPAGRALMTLCAPVDEDDKEGPERDQLGAIGQQ